MKAYKKVVKFAALQIIGVSVLAMAVGAIIAAVTLQVLGSVKATMTASSAEANATTSAISGISQVTTQYPTIGIVVAMVIIISIIVGGLGFLLYNKKGN